MYFHFVDNHFKRRYNVSRFYSAGDELAPSFIGELAAAAATVDKIRVRPIVLSNRANPFLYIKMIIGRFL